jgi:hypothetical protein
LAALVSAFGYVHPADVTWTYFILSILGGLVGIIAGVAFGITALFVFSRQDAGEKGLPHKTADDVNEL